YRTADIHSRHVDPAQEFSIEGKHFKTILFTGGADKFGVTGIAGIHRYTVGIDQVMVGVGIVPSPEMPDILSLMIILDNIVGSIPVRNINIAVRSDSGFCGHKAFIVFVDTDGTRVADR